MALTLSVLLCFASGFLLVRLSLVRLYWWRVTAHSLPTDFLFQSSLSVGYGLGLFSIVYFLFRLAGFAHLLMIDAAVFTLLLIANFIRRDRTAAPSFRATPEESSPTWLLRLLTVAFFVALLAALYAFTMRMLGHPHGEGLDAFAIWNLHARFLYLGGSHWRDGFTSLIEWSHPDYPLLLPAAITHFWTILGRDSPAVPAVIGFLFTFSTVGLLVSSLNILRGRVTAMLGGIVLLTTPAFIEVGVWQYADVPLSFFFLAVVVLLCLSSDEARPSGCDGCTALLALAGTAAGFAAWTKNEGLLFLCAIVAARFCIAVWISRAGKIPPRKIFELPALLLTAAPILLITVYFKRAVAPPNDLFSDAATMIHKLLTPSRYWDVFRWYAKDFLPFGGWLIPTTVVMLACYLVKKFAARGSSATQSANSNICWLTLVITLAGYFVIYLITPYDIEWHLRFSLDRLFLQLWPSVIFLFFAHKQDWEQRPDHQTTCAGSKWD